MPSLIRTLLEAATSNAGEANVIYVFYNPVTGAVHTCPYWEDESGPEQILANIARFSISFAEEDGEGYIVGAAAKFNAATNMWLPVDG